MQTKADLMVRLVHAGLFVPMRVFEEKRKAIVHQSVLGLKQELIVKFTCVFNWIEWLEIMSHKFHNLASKIANSPECCFLLEDALDRLGPELEDKLKELATNAKNGSSNGQDQENVDPNVQQANDLLRSAKLKKKEVSSKNLRRKQNWFDKLRKGRKPMKVVAPTQKGAKVSCLCNMSWLFFPKQTS
jgi:hypothetical protein